METRRFFKALFVSCAMVLAMACSTEYDDTELWDAVNSQDDRIAALEAWQKQVNADISSLKTLVAASQNGDYIVSVEPFTNGNGGYIVTLSSGQKLTINNGAKGDKGDTGYSPVIGVKMDTNGVYYWTLDGEFIIVNDQKFPVTGPKGEQGDKGDQGEKGDKGDQGEPGNHGGDKGDKGDPGTDGTNGITPQLKIENDYWYISYDNGVTWTELGRATGKDGIDGINGTNGSNGADGDSFFRGITQDDANVYFTLTDGTVITIPKAVPLSISFDTDDMMVLSPNTYNWIYYTVTSSADNVKVEVVSSADITTTAYPDDASGKTGTIQVITSNQVTEYSKIVVLVSDGKEVIMRSIHFEETGMQINDNSLKNVPAEGGEVTLEFMSNTAYDVIFRNGSESWISVVSQTRAMELHTVTLRVEPNSGYDRNTVVAVMSTDGWMNLSYIIEQPGAKGPDPYQIHYTADNVIGGLDKADYIKTWNYYAVSDGYISRELLGRVTISENTADDAEGVDYLNISGLSTLSHSLDDGDDTVPIEWWNGHLYATAGNYLGMMSGYYISDLFVYEEGTNAFFNDGLLIGAVVADGFVAFVSNSSITYGGMPVTFSGIRYGAFDYYDPATGFYTDYYQGHFVTYKWLLLVDPAVDTNVNATTIAEAMSARPTNLVELRGVELGRALLNENNRANKLKTNITR
jgi:hypothetical protein